MADSFLQLFGKLQQKRKCLNGQNACVSTSEVKTVVELKALTDGKISKTFVGTTETFKSIRPLRL